MNPVYNGRDTFPLLSLHYTHNRVFHYTALMSGCFIIKENIMCSNFIWDIDADRCKMHLVAAQNFPNNIGFFDKTELIMLF